MLRNIENRIRWKSVVETSIYKVEFEMNGLFLNAIFRHQRKRQISKMRPR